MTYKMLIINPGSTTTKIGIFEDEHPQLIENLKHSLKEIEQYNSIYDQFNFRKKIIMDVLKGKNFDMSALKAVVGRGGLLRPMTGGTYSVTDEMLRDLKEGIQGQHACNLGGAIANEIAKELKVPAYIVDPVVVDEMEDVARISGMPEIQRKSIFHALNQKAVARRYAKEYGKKYEEINLIVAHIGGGVSVGAHKSGKVVDVNNALDGEGPFSPERSGGVPVGDLVKMCYSGKYTIDEIKKKITGKGGFVAYLNTNNAIEVDQAAAAGDEKAKLIFEAMAYQVAKEIGKCAPVLYGKVDAIILTGGMSYSKSMVDYVRERVGFIAPVVVYPGEDEMLALAEGALRILRGEEKVKIYE